MPSILISCGTRAVDMLKSLFLFLLNVIPLLIFINLGWVLISCPSLLLHFAEYSNNINQKKNEINKEQQRARKLLGEFVREIDVSCQQGTDKNILGEPRQLVTCCKHSPLLGLRGWEKDSNK